MLAKHWNNFLVDLIGIRIIPINCGERRSGIISNVQYSKQNNNQDYVIQEVHEVLSVFDRNANLFNEGVNLETTIQSDYTHPSQRE